MTPKFYSFIWVLFFVSAGALWLAGALTLVGVVVFGFVAFGMVFTGMMCVLPGMTSHQKSKMPKMPKLENASKPAADKPATAVSGFSAYRSARVQ